MASDPIPEPLTNQEVEAEKEPKFAESVNARPSLESGNTHPLPELSNTRPISSATATLPQPPAVGERDDVPQSPLHRSARAVGTALGQAANAARNASQRASESGEQLSESARETTESLKNRAADQVSQAREGVVVAINKAKREAEINYRQLREQATEASRRGYEKIQQIGRERPIQLIATCAGAGFVIGAVLRVWRSGRYE
jgi:ElaB/YqjD/DUF883 family membrane-anchored ribosome-binding protein